ncbi:5'-3' exoribonuclease 1, partial [Elysia marginata]
MGVPKFYRWISERYPCLSEVVKEFQLPEFDNLYLDMNGIIHVCSHPNDDDPHFRISEEIIFKNICHYIDFLYRMIKPRKVFFMAVDGVAPRAKMNQQRGRRFRSAREAEQNEQKAQERGEILPTEKRFDSNCITPGTPFMVRLQNHLKYFVIDKMTNDPLWQGRRIFLSGHETPGEGEHKVMDFIRYSKSQPDYDPDTRHCLYGLDADLIMLGLLSHEPRFSLLREEVRFGGHKDKNNKRPMTPEETTFHLLHLSLLRDYLAYEFADLKGKTSFTWDLEKLIDDWILMGFLVGNDFIPHLPHLHIQHDALPLLWRTYKKVMPTKLGGKAINESAGASRDAAQSRHPKPKLKELKPFKMKQNGNAFAALEDDTPLDPLDDIDDKDSDDDEDEDDEEDDDDDESSEDDDEDCNTFEDEFRLHKKDYYMSKMAYTSVTPDVIKEQARGYVTAIQWILLYYFEGCPSWSWFYAHHYAPYISDIKGFSDLKITFDLSTPFLPFQQLMAVLPAASKELLPPALQPLMTEESSPVLDFYPVRFDTDLNGKQQDWEAVVLIPFIEEDRLLAAMSSREHLLSKEERLRNRHGPHLLYEYSPDNQGFYPSSLPGVFPDLNINKAKLTEIDKHLFHIDANKLRKGLLDATRLNVYFPGFPTLRFLPHTFSLTKAGVKVFQQCSRGENMTLRVQAQENLVLEKVADELLGKETFVGWPHLHEARVTAVANESYKIELEEVPSKKGKKEPTVSFNRRPLDDHEARVVARDASSIKERLMDRFAIDVGKTEIVVYASAMTGRSYTFGLHGAIALSKQFANRESPYVYQMTVQDVEVEKSTVATLKTLGEVFPQDSPVFMVGNPHYGAQGTVLEVLPDVGRVRIVLDVSEEPDFTQMSQTRSREDYVSNIHAAQHIGLDGHLMSRITGSIFVERTGAEDNKKGKVNIGLNLKFTKKMEEVPGYTKKLERGWFYSWKCVEQVEDYVNT